MINKSLTPSATSQFCKTTPKYVFQQIPTLLKTPKTKQLKPFSCHFSHFHTGKTTKSPKLILPHKSKSVGNPRTKKIHWKERRDEERGKAQIRLSSGKRDPLVVAARTGPMRDSLSYPATTRVVLKCLTSKTSSQPHSNCSTGRKGEGLLTATAIYMCMYTQKGCWLIEQIIGSNAIDLGRKRSSCTERATIPRNFSISLIKPHT